MQRREFSYLGFRFEAVSDGRGVLKIAGLESSAGFEVMLATLPEPSLLCALVSAYYKGSSDVIVAVGELVELVELVDPRLQPARNESGSDGSSSHDQVDTVSMAELSTGGL